MLTQVSSNRSPLPLNRPVHRQDGMSQRHEAFDQTSLLLFLLRLLPPILLNPSDDHKIFLMKCDEKSVQ
jgi:hypothetical protein